MAHSPHLGRRIPERNKMKTEKLGRLTHLPQKGISKMGPSERPENKEPRPLDGQKPRSRTKLSASRWKRKAVSLLRTAVEEEFYIVQSISSSGPKAAKDGRCGICQNNVYQQL